MLLPQLRGHAISSRSALRNPIRPATSFVLLALSVAAATSGSDVSAREARSPITSSEEAALARDFRPILRFDSAEPWRPVSVDAVVAESFAGGRHRFCTDNPEPAPDTCNDLNSVGQIQGGAPTHIDLFQYPGGTRGYRAPALRACPQRTQPRGLLDCNAGPTSAIYYNASLRGDLLYIDYWWFLRFNDFPAGTHEGDWEGVTVVLGAQPRWRVLFVVFDAHGRQFRYRRSLVQFTGRRPHVFVALGSHGAYPRPCVQRSCIRTGSSPLPEPRFNGRARWGNNRNAACGTTCVVPLPETLSDPAVSPAGNAAAWNAWPGRWGALRTALVSFSGPPRSPGLQGRYREPWRYKVSKRRRF
jgi:hypothetical protein